MTTQEHDTPVPVSRKPRLAIMGEFSVGKSTLCNLLIGAAPLPVKVTATQLPPVWIAHGTKAPFRIDKDGVEIPIDLDRLNEVPLDDTAMIRIFLEADLLELCDLIDMPGISDPNMSSQVWESALHHADGVLWCTHATQAWRQSEAAVWESLPAEIHQNSLLLVTRIDKLLSDRDVQRVMKRVTRETDGLFAARYPVSLTRALQAEYDRDQWVSSGADAFTQRLLELIEALSQSALSERDQDALRPCEATAPAAAPAPMPGDNFRRLEVAQTPPQAPFPAPTEGPAIRPARVKAVVKTTRPPRNSKASLI
jgi:hypothetical protein